MSITIGRSSRCDIIVPNNFVSGVHAEISKVNGQYVYRDRSSNGSTINGQIIHNSSVAIAPGTNVLMADRVPLPWDRIYQQLPLQGVNAFEETGKTVFDPVYVSRQEQYRPSLETESSPVGWCILAFLIPLLGWILYFGWKADNPAKALAVCRWAWIGFATNFVIGFLSVL